MNTSRRYSVMTILPIITVTILVIYIIYLKSELHNMSGRNAWINYAIKDRNKLQINVNKNVGRNFQRKKTFDLRIIAMVFDRANSLKRLLNSLNEADYIDDDILLEVWIDRRKDGSCDIDTVNTARNFIFRHGEYQVIIHKEHAGLYGQWLTTYDANNFSGSEIVVFFEDDITVSPHYYKYLKLVHAKYNNQSDVNGYSLNGVQTVLAQGESGVISGPPNEPVMKYPALGSWGFSPNIPNWRHFLQWFDKAQKNESFHPYVPNNKATLWYIEHENTGKTENMWTIWHIYHAWLYHEYTIHLNFPDHQGLTANWAEKGLHFTGGAPKKSNPLLETWNLDYSMLPDNPVKLDLAGNIIQNT